MVALRILVPPVRVRILPGQQKIGISILLIPIFITINQVLMLQNRLVNHYKLLLHNTFIRQNISNSFLFLHSCDTIVIQIKKNLIIKL